MAARPAHLDRLRALRVAQPEEQSRVGRGEVGGPAHSGPHPGAPPGGHRHARPDRVPAAARADEPDAEPAPAAPPVVAQEADGLPHADEEDVRVPVVVVVPHRDPAAHVGDPQRLPPVRRDVREAPAVVLEEERRVRVADLRPDLCHGGEGVAGGDEEVGVAVVVVVEEAGPEAAVLERGHREPDDPAAVHEPHPAAVRVQEGPLAVEVRDQQVQPPVPVHVLGVGGHGPGGAPRRVEGHLGLEGHVAEAAVAEVPEEEVGGGVVRLEDVDPPVVVEVGGHHPHPLPHEGGDAGRSARVLERPVAPVPEEDARLALEPQDRAEGVAVDQLAGVAAGAGLRRVELEVVRDEEVEPAVAVVVEEGRAAAPEPVVDTGPRGHVAETAAALVVVEDAAAVGGDVHVRPAVVVVVPHREAHPPPQAADPGALRDLGEGPVAVVAEEGVPPAAGAGVGLERARDEVDVQPAVAVEVEEPAAATHGLDEVPVAAHQPPAPDEARTLRDVHVGWRRDRGGLRGQGQRSEEPRREEQHAGDRHGRGGSAPAARPGDARCRSSSSVKRARSRAASASRPARA